MEQSPTRWQKALWCEQHFPDNHTDEHFLESIIINADIVQRNYWHVVWASFAVDQQLCIAAIVASTAYALHQGSLSVHTLFFYESCLLLGGASLSAALKQSSSSPRARRWLLLLLLLFKNSASTAALLALTALLSPVYATLTSSISPDTIVACSTTLLLAHLYLHEYYYQGRSAAASSFSSHKQQHKGDVAGGPSLRGSLGLACAMCASVLMASQLTRLADVFALVSF